MHTVLRSASKEVVIGDDQPFCIIGERINPTGRKIFQEQLRAGDLSRIEIDVAQQVAGGAMVLDVNMGAPLADEVELMIQAVKLDPEPHRPAALHRLVGHRGARGRAVDLRGQGARQLGDRRGRAARGDPAAREALRRGDHRAAERRVRDPRAARAPPRARPQDRRGGDEPVRHRHRGHRARPAGDADRRRHHPSSSRRSRRSRSSTTSSA